MIKSDILLIAGAIKDCQLAYSSMEAEIMRARIAGRMARILLSIPGFNVDEFFDACGLQVPQSHAKQAMKFPFTKG